MKHLVKNKYWELNKDYNLDKLLYLLIDRYDHYQQVCGDVYWYNIKLQHHRDYNLPSIINDNYGYVAWYFKGTRHRENNKPSRIWIDGSKEYWVNGNPFK